MANLFRNVDGSPSDPVDTWPYEGMVSVIERGNIRDWAPLIYFIRRDPWGRVARNLEIFLGYTSIEDVRVFFRLVLDDARERAEASERKHVQEIVEASWRRSGLSRQSFARAIGTSPSRLSTYFSGSVIPSAAMVVRMQRVADHYQARASRGSEGAALG